MVDRLRKIKSDMAFMGWKGDPETGFSHKEDVNGKPIARHHDATWLADYEEADARAQRNEIRYEIERRAAERTDQ